MSRYIGRVKGRLLVLFCAMIAVLWGCKKSDSSQQTARQPEMNAPNLVRIHWLGKKRISAETNAAGFMQIWNLPETVRLEAQTLDKLALALSTNLPGATNTDKSLGGSSITNYAELIKGPSAILRPLLNDLVQEECYLQVRQATNEAWCLVLALRLNDARAGAWETNLAAAVESITGTHPSSSADKHGWQAQIPRKGTRLNHHLLSAAGRVELARAAQWTLIGLAKDQNSLFEETVNRIKSGNERNPFNASTTNFWLEADLDLRTIGQEMAGWKLPQNSPRISLTMIGDGMDVLTRAQIDFAEPPSFQIEPWKIPTNLIRGSLVSFSAVQGIKPWLSSISTLADLQLRDVPNQLFSWSQGGPIFRVYWAAPLENASNTVHVLTQQLISKANTYLTNNSDSGKLEQPSNSNGVVWAELGLAKPYLESVNTPQGEFITAGLSQALEENQQLPPEILQQLLNRTNLVYYDWELTGGRIDDWIFMGQFFRFSLNRAQLRGASPGLKWLSALHTNLGNCVTAVMRPAPARLVLSRKSTFGMSAVELHLLVDWLESPEFPHGFYTLLAKPPLTDQPKAQPSK